MVAERKLREAQTFLNKKGKKYAIDIASTEERKYFDGILYNKGIPSFMLINYCHHSLPTLEVN